MNGLKRYSSNLFYSAGFLLAALLAGCGGGDQGRDPILGLPAADLTSVAVTPATSSVAIGNTQQLVATATFADGSTRDITAVSVWTSAAPGIATVNGMTGLATGVASGTAAMTASFRSKTGSANVTVLPPALVSIALTPVNPTVNIGASLQLVVTGTYSDKTTADLTNVSTYVSASPAIASVNSTTGMSKGLSGGSAVITASYATQSATTIITVPAAPVTPPATLSSITVTPANASILVGATQAYTATATYSDNSTVNITQSAIWASGNTAVASVNSTGLATGVSAGATMISATSGTKSGSANLIVTVPVNPPASGINLGTATTFGVLAGTSITNNAGGTTLVTGDVGSPSQTTDPVQAAGFTNYKSGAVLTNALADLQTAITDANSRTCDVNSAAGIDLGGLTLTPGVYCYAGAISITGTFTMSGPGLYLFRSSSTLNTTANSIVALTNGATYDSVFWVPVGATTLGANSVFKGTIMGKAAAITLGDGASLLNGRVLTGAAATLRNNKITK
ncbi:Ig-like domain-containing protein [Undibacterium sp. Jales W-56]|uniref:Ig-like domain-containing protein n=1 Tax=Undibacterium sp. Jales W-56 TaxID=2897325 RepID=UPI0021D3A95A|nr:ice-binding family protein [Undibacterium sp. Jales W-56]MCU6434059.1 Ig-like domain-containing protein [Undibacterium sp. Jales W-56]